MWRPGHVGLGHLERLEHRFADVALAFHPGEPSDARPPATRIPHWSRCDVRRGARARRRPDRARMRATPGGRRSSPAGPPGRPPAGCPPRSPRARPWPSTPWSPRRGGTAGWCRRRRQARHGVPRRRWRRWRQASRPTSGRGAWRGRRWGHATRNEPPWRHTVPIPPIASQEPRMSFYDFDVRALDGSSADLHDYAGDALLVVNVASKCGLTPQYDGAREDSTSSYADRGFTRARRSRATSSWARSRARPRRSPTFCSTTYGVTFPLFEKIEVNGEDRDPLYAELTDDRRRRGRTPATSAGTSRSSWCRPPVRSWPASRRRSIPTRPRSSRRSRRNSRLSEPPGPALSPVRLAALPIARRGCARWSAGAGLPHRIDARGVGDGAGHRRRPPPYDEARPTVP